MRFSSIRVKVIKIVAEVNDARRIRRRDVRSCNENRFLNRFSLEKINFSLIQRSILRKSTRNRTSLIQTERTKESSPRAPLERPLSRNGKHIEVTPRRVRAANQTRRLAEILPVSTLYILSREGSRKIHLSR